jgi:hypothetical protein
VDAVKRARLFRGGAREVAAEGELVTGTSDEGRSRVYHVEGGVKRWVLSPEVFAERGWKFEDVLTLPDDELEAIPISDEVIGGHLLFVPRDNARKRLAAPFLAGVGLELGAGMYPQLLPDGAKAELFELRDPAEVARLFGTRQESLPSFEALEAIRGRFPAGADFLIAHNVLEHCADPIATVLEWSSYVVDAGAIVLSVPCAEFCPDKGRLVPSIDHVLFDFLLSRGADHFESREHAYSCTAGWMNTWEDWLPLDKRAVAEQMHLKAHMRDLDVHWHAFTPRLFDQLLQVVARFCERPLYPMAWGDPYLEGDARTVGDIIAVLRVGGAPLPTDLGFREPDVGDLLQRTGDALERARARVRSPVR